MAKYTFTDKSSKTRISKYFIRLTQHLLTTQFPLMQWQTKLRKTRHSTLPYYTALEFCCDGFDNTVRCGQIYDFRFATKSESLLWQEFLKKLVKKLEKIVKAAQ